MRSPGNALERVPWKRLCWKRQGLFTFIHVNCNPLSLLFSQLFPHVFLFAACIHCKKMREPLVLPDSGAADVANGKVESRISITGNKREMK